MRDRERGRAVWLGKRWHGSNWSLVGPLPFLASRAIAIDLERASSLCPSPSHTLTLTHWTPRLTIENQFGWQARKIGNPHSERVCGVAYAAEGGKGVGRRVSCSAVATRRRCVPSSACVRRPIPGTGSGHWAMNARCPRARLLALQTLACKSNSMRDHFN